MVNEMSELTPIAGDNKYCGPSALASIVGLTTDEAEKVIQNVLRSNKPVKGLWPVDLRKAFNEVGYHCSTVNFPKGTTIFRAMFYLMNNNGYYVFEIPRHYVAIEVMGAKRFICDNHSRKPIELCNSARLNQKIISVFKVVKK